MRLNIVLYFMPSHTILHTLIFKFVKSSTRNSILINSINTYIIQKYSQLIVQSLTLNETLTDTNITVDNSKISKKHGFTWLNRYLY